MGLEEYLPEKRIMRISPKNFSIEGNRYTLGPFFTFQEFWSDFILREGIQEDFGVIMEGEEGLAECYGLLRDFHKRAELKRSRELPFKNLAEGLSKEDAEKLQENLNNLLLSLSYVHRPRNIIKYEHNPPRAIVVHYPYAEVSFKHLALDLHVSDQIVVDWFNQRNKETRKFFRTECDKGALIVYNIALGKLREIEEWRAEQFQFRTDKENLEDFLLDRHDDGRTVAEIFVDRCVRHSKRKNRILVGSPSTYYYFLLPFAKSKPALKEVHRAMMEKYKKDTEESPRVKELKEVSREIDQEIKRKLESHNIRNGEFAYNLRVKSEFRIPVLSLRYDQLAYEEIFRNISTYEQRRAPPALSDELRRLGFFVWRKAYQPYKSQPNFNQRITAYALVKIKHNEMLWDSSNPSALEEADRELVSKDQIELPFGKQRNIILVPYTVVPRASLGKDDLPF